MVVEPPPDSNFSQQPLGLYSKHFELNLFVSASSNNGLNDVLPYMDLRVGKFVNVSKHPTSPADFHLGQVDFGGKDKNVTVLPGPMPRQVSVETFKV